MATRSLANKTGLEIEQTKTDTGREPGLVSDQRHTLEPVNTQTSDTYQTLNPGELLDEEKEKKLAKKLWKWWHDRDDELAPQEAEWEANDRRRAGIVGVQVRKDDPDKAPRVWTPPAATRIPPTLNKAARLCRRFVSNLTVDRRLAECTPGSAGDNTDPDAAEYATRLLNSVCGPTHLNYPKLERRALSKQCSYDSGFLWFVTDPRGGGHRPKAILASPQATTVEDATHRPDPAGGDPVPQPEPFKTRYVRPDDSLTDKAEEANLEWLPRVKATVLDGTQVRLYPQTATDIDEAELVLILTWQSLDSLRQQFPDYFAKLGEGGEETADEKIRALVTSSPDDVKDRMPEHVKEPKQEVREGSDDSEIPGDSMVVTLTCYAKQCPSYPKGAYIVIGGEHSVLHSQEWTAKVRGVPKALRIPVSQYKGFEEGVDNQYGRGLMSLLGAGNEIRAAIIGTLIEHLYRFNNRKTFYSPSSLFQPKQAHLLGAYVPIQKGTEPVVEEIPNYDPMGMKLFEFSTFEMDDEVGLPPVAQGQSEPEVQSGLHQQKIMEQVNVGLSDVKQATDDGFTRSMSIILEQIQAFYTKAQKIAIIGDDGEYKHEEFTGADLAGEYDIMVMRGTGTMLAPSAKLAVAEHAVGLGLIDRLEMKRIWTTGVGGDLGVKDDPALLRVKGQIAAFNKGPEQNLVAQLQQEKEAAATAPPPDPAVNPEAIDPATGQPLPPPPGPIATRIMQQAAAIFEPLPNDEEPALGGVPTPDPATGAAAPDSSGAPMGQAGAMREGNALLRFRELSRNMNTRKYQSFPAEWQSPYEAEYHRMRKAAGIVLQSEIEAQVMAQQQAEQATQQQEQQKVQAEADARAAESEAKLGLERDKLTMEDTRERDRMAGEQQIALQKAEGERSTVAAAIEGLAPVLQGSMVELARNLPAPLVNVQLPSAKKRVVRDADGIIQGVEPVEEEAVA